MKKFFVSSGLAAISVAALQQGVLAEGLDVVSPKAWTVSGTLRGFYDDNYNIAEANKGSWGVEVSPSISLNVPLQQTDFGLRYYYTLYYYNDRDSIHLNPFDQSHQIELWLHHAFNQNWKLTATDHLALGQEPELLQPAQGGGRDVNYRINGNNLANQANISLDTQWTRHFSTTLSYANSYYDYDNQGATLGSVSSPPSGLILAQAFSVPVSSYSGAGVSPGWRELNGGASLSGLLDRDEHNISLDFNWTFSPETKIFAGYSFSQVNYLGNEPVAIYNYVSGFSPNLPPPPYTLGDLLSGSYDPQNPQSFVYTSSMRDSRSHNGHIGLSHQLTANISLALSAGVSYNDSYNSPIQHTTSISPSANASISYTYIPGSYVQLGVSQGENATDVVSPGSDGSLTQYQHSTSVYADLNHRITDKLSGTLICRYVYSSFEGGAANSQTESDYNVGVNLNYQINRHFSADAGYNFDDLITPLNGRGFVRNRVYLGLTASY
jgi:hypothetical protein